MGKRFTTVRVVRVSLCVLIIWRFIATDAVLYVRTSAAFSRVNSFVLREKKAQLSQNRRYCSVGYDESKMSAILKLKKRVTIRDRVWEVRPFSFSLSSAKQVSVGFAEELDILLVIVESLKVGAIPTKFPKLHRKLLQLSQDRFSVSYFGVNRVGGNSRPNRGALLLGSSLIRKKVKPNDRLGSRSLFDVSIKNDFKVIVSEMVERPCQHYANTLNIMVGDCARFRRAYRSVYTPARCVQPRGSTAGTSCPAFPYPSRNLPTNCSGNSIHDVMVSQVLDDTAKSRRTFTVMNFLDFHAPMLDYTSPDLDHALHRLIEGLENRDTGKFRLLLVGDHGHGVVSETGDAAGLLLTTKDEDSMKYVNAVTVPMLSHFSVNKLVRMMMAGTCGSEEIPPQYCGKCQYNNRTNDWKAVFESSDVRAIVTMESETQSQVRIKSLSFGVSLERGISCMSDAVESSVGIQLAFTVSAGSCSASYIFEYGGGLTSGALTSYEPFKRCDPRWRDSIHVVLTRPDGQQVCISPKTRKSYMKRAGAPCRSVF